MESELPRIAKEITREKENHSTYVNSGFILHLFLSSSVILAEGETYR